MKKEKIFGILILVFCGLSVIIGIYNLEERKFARVSVSGPEEIALLNIYGTLTHPSEGMISGFYYTPDKIVEDLESISTQPQIKGVILRINSPGGTVAAVQEIYEAIKKIKANGKPVVVSIGDICASGGYYISCAADKIVANPGSLTGSIGVIMSFANLEGFLRKIGMEIEVIKSGKYKDMGSGTRKMSAEEIKLMEGIINDAYQQFLNAVKEGRNLSDKQLKEIAQGQLFTGNQAKQLGLVDELGDLSKAIEIVSDLAEIKGKPNIREYPRPLLKFMETLPMNKENFDFNSMKEPVSLEYILR